MDLWKYFDITHKHHLVCNPTSVAKLDMVIGLLRLGPGARVVDIACGKAEMLTRLAERYGITGVGVDISPYFASDARKKLQERAPKADIRLLQMDGAQYRPETPGSFDLAMCVGASWVFNGHRGTLRALKEMTRPGGLVLVGEPYWIREPSDQYLAAEGAPKREEFSSHLGNVAIGGEGGLAPLYTCASNQDDWDMYVTLQWYATDEYVRTHADDPDLPELLAKQAQARELYLRWERDTLGWAMYLFRRP
ncbi:MAG: class I SAM-dependent methyltransferase [Chloroflexi bacterium]|nr:class I SAM-dependent methyltransferase [Chloroflexota bacterium]